MRISDWSSDVCSSDLDGARDRLRLAALLGADAGIGAGGVYQGDDRQAEPLRQAHEALRLAVALRAGHAEVVLHTAVDVGALLVADDHDGVAAEAPQATNVGVVLREQAVAGKGCELPAQLR